MLGKFKISYLIFLFFIVLNGLFIKIIIPTSADLEILTPNRFVSLENATLNINSISNTPDHKKIFVKGLICNKAFKSIYKDVKIEMTFLTNANTILKYKSFVFHDTILPQSKKLFSWSSIDSSAELMNLQSYKVTWKIESVNVFNYSF